MNIFEPVAESNNTSSSFQLGTKEKGKAGRPSKAQQLKRHMATKRTPITGEKSLLAVTGKDPKFKYRWVRDIDESGSEVLRFLSAGYEFVMKSDNIEIGDHAVYTSKAIGSMIRVPAGRDGDYLYLMKIPKDWYEMDQESKARAIDKTEEAIKAPDIGGSYGSIKIS